MKEITIYSDGSSLGNPGPGGWGTILEYKGNIKELSGGNPLTTNNQMELTGAIEGLKALKEPCKVKIISDSKYVVQAINEWLNNWIKNNWRTAGKKPVKNLDLWQEYVEVSQGHIIDAVWVKGHNGHPQNERCDELARNEAELLR
ncbi:MAG: ribonuclease HI [Campylobacterota bacterium]|nr:ribonuclease HI [Campylobacterota bacterium]